MSKSNRIKNNRLNSTKDVVEVKKGMNPILKRVIIWALVVVLVLGSVGILVTSAMKKNGTFIKNADGIIVDGTTYKASVIDHYYRMYYNSLYAQALQYYNQYGMNVFGIDFSSSLFNQAYPNDTDKDGNPDYKTWGDYLLSEAISTFFSYTALNNEAKANGFFEIEGINDCIDKTVEKTIDQTKEAAEKAGTTYLSYLRTYYGNSCTEQTYEEAIRKESIANLYSSYLQRNIQIDDWKVTDEYKENSNNYDTVSYRDFTLTINLPEHVNENGEKYSDDVTKEEDEKIIVEVASRLKEALKIVDSEETFEACARQFTVNSKEVAEKIVENKDFTFQHTDVAFDSLTTDEQTILFAEDTVPGQTFVNRNENTLNVYYFINRNDNSYKARSFRHILLVSDEKNTEIENQAKEILAQWNAGEKTEESFGKLAAKYSDDAGSMIYGGLIDNVGKGNLVTEINDWLFDQYRAPGDTDIIFSESYGYHICLYCGESETEYRYVMAEQKLVSEEYQTLYDSIMKAHSYKTLDGLSKIR